MKASFRASASECAPVTAVHVALEPDRET